jgi:hypothetical protein
MKISAILLIAIILLASTVSARQTTDLSCNDFRPSNDALERFPQLVGACEGIVERDGQLFGLFRAEVRRVRGNTVTWYLPATNRVITTSPDASVRVLSNDRKVRPRDLARGDEIRIYLSVDEFSKPDIEEVALLTESDVLVAVAIDGIDGMRIEQIPGRVVTSTVETVVIVEAIDRETREISVIDSSGLRYSIVAGDMVRNFDQLEPRDRIVTEYLESVAIFVTPADAPALGDAGAIEVAPLGEKPGVAVADTYMVRATIEAINVDDRIATLRGDDGRTRTVKLAGNVPLELVAVGDEVRMRITEAIAITVRKADKS